MLEGFQVSSYYFSNYRTLNDNLLYLDHILSKFNFNIIPVDPHTAYKYQGNFMGLMKELNIEPSLYMYTMYANNIISPTDFNGKIDTITVPIRPPIPPT